MVCFWQLVATDSYRYNEQDSLFVPFLDEEKPHVRYLAEDGDKTLWIDTNKRTDAIQSGEETVRFLPTLIQPFTLQCNNAVLISSNQLLFNTNNDFFRLSYTKQYPV